MPVLRRGADGLGTGQASAVAGRTGRWGCVVAGDCVAAPRRHGGGDRVGVGCKANRRVGFRRIAAELARPAETVRGWLRRFAERAEAVRSVFTIWLRAVDADPVMPDAVGSGFADAVTVIAAVATAITHRFSLPMVSLAGVAVAVSGGRLLAPDVVRSAAAHRGELAGDPQH